MEYFDIHSTVNITHYTDNVQVVKYHDHMQNNRKATFPYFDDYDLYSNMDKYYKTITARGVTISTMRKINSNKTIDTAPSILPEQLHSTMDGKARSHRSNNEMPQYISISQPSAYLSNANGRITSNEKSFMENQWSTKILERYYQKRWRCTKRQLNQYDWNTYHAIYKKSRPSIQVYMIKMSTGWLPVRHHTNKMTQVQQQCPLCSSDETIAHLFQCVQRQQWHSTCLLYTSPSPRDGATSRMPSSA